MAMTLTHKTVLIEVLYEEFSEVEESGIQSQKQQPNGPIAILIIKIIL